MKDSCFLPSHHHHQHGCLFSWAAKNRMTGSVDTIDYSPPQNFWSSFWLTSFTAHFSPFLAFSYQLLKNWCFSRRRCSINSSQLIPNLHSTPTFRLKQSMTTGLFQQDILLAPQINSINPLHRSRPQLSTLKSKPWHRDSQQWGPYLGSHTRSLLPALKFLPGLGTCLWLPKRS